MNADIDTRWLDREESEAWRALWSMMTWLPAGLDSQLRADAGLSLPEYHALSQISEAPDRTMRLSELASITNMTLSHLSRVMSRMVNAGWVTRQPDPADGRYTLGSLTEAGWQKVVEAAPGHVQAVRRTVFDQLNAEQVRSLAKISQAVSKAARPDSA